MQEKVQKKNIVSCELIKENIKSSKIDYINILHDLKIYTWFYKMHR